MQLRYAMVVIAALVGCGQAATAMATPAEDSGDNDNHDSVTPAAPSPATAAPVVTDPLADAGAVDSTNDIDNPNVVATCASRASSAKGSFTAADVYGVSDALGVNAALDVPGQLSLGFDLQADLWTEADQPWRLDTWTTLALEVLAPTPGSDPFAAAATSTVRVWSYGKFHRACTTTELPPDAVSNNGKVLSDSAKLVITMHDATTIEGNVTITGQDGPAVLTFHASLHGALPEIDSSICCLHAY